MIFYFGLIKKRLALLIIPNYLLFHTLQYFKDVQFHFWYPILLLSPIIIFSPHVLKYPIICSPTYCYSNISLTPPCFFSFILPFIWCFLPLLLGLVFGVWPPFSKKFICLLLFFIPNLNFYDGKIFIVVHILYVVHILSLYSPIQFHLILSTVTMTSILATCTHCVAL